MTKKCLALIILSVIPVFFLYSLTLNEAISIGLENSPQLMASQEALNQAKWDYNHSLSALLPTASIVGSYAKYSPTLMNNTKNQTSYGIQANQVIFTGGKNWQNRGIKKNNYEIAEENLNLKKIEVIADIENKYFNALEKQNALEIASNELQNAQLNEQIAVIRHKNGSIAEAELLRMKSQTVHKRVALIQANTNYKNSLLDLQNTIGTNKEIVLSGFEDNSPSEMLDEIVNWDMERIDAFIEKISRLSLVHNLSIKASQKGIENMQRQLSVASGNFLPSLSLSFSKNYAKSNIDSDYKDSGTIMLNASVPIFPVVNNVSSYLNTKSGLRKTQHENQILINNISLNARTLALAWINAIQSAYSAELSLQYAQQSREQQYQRYRNGVISGSDMLDADIMLSTANSQYLSARFNILRNKSNLKKMLNLSSDEDFFNLLKN